MARPSMLAGRRVVVTRELQRAESLVDALERAGATPVVIPAVTTEPPADGGRALREALDGRARHDWILFTSAEAVRVVAALTGGAARSGGAARVGVVGPATAAAATAAGMDVSLQPRSDDSSGAGLARALLAAEDGPRTALVPSSDLARPDLPDALRDRGWDVDVVAAYRTVTRPADDDDERSALTADAIVFYSPSAVEAWVGHRLPAVVTIGPTTSAAVRRGGWPVAAEATDRTPDAVVAALVAALG